MKCPVCKKRLKCISPAQPGEYICDNRLCPDNQKNKGVGAYAEFYGDSQTEINFIQSQKHG